MATVDVKRGKRSRAAWLREQIGAPAPKDVMGREEVLGLLSERARSGSITAAVALERALRHRPTAPDADAELEREFDELLRGLPE